jgi:elongation factor G
MLTDSLLRGALLGFPVINTRIRVIDGVFDRKRTSAVLLKRTLVNLVLQGLKRASPMLLEPIMKVEIFASHDFIPSIATDLSANKRGEILESKETSILALVPLSRLIGYSTNLRSMTKGEGTFTMILHDYYFVGAQDQEELINQL